MAGFYTDAPSQRIAYDIDGTSIVELSGTFVSVGTPSSGEIDALNGEYESGATNSIINVRCLAFIFPQALDLVGLYVEAEPSTTFTIYTSTNTTNGVDGTWSAGSAFTGTEFVDPSNQNAMRQSIQAITGAGVVGLRILSTNSGEDWSHVHIYGTLTSPGDNLAFWHPTLDEEVGPAYFDWGNAQRDTEDTITFRIKNLSTTLTANTVGLSLSALTPGSPDITTEHELSDDDADYNATLALGNISPEAISAVCYLKRTLGSTSDLGPAWLRIEAEPASWS